MTTRPLLSITAALIAAVSLTGCTEESAGSPLPDARTTTTTVVPDSTEPTSSETSSARPREIRLDGKDPCALIPQSDWPGLGIERPGNPSEDPTFKSPDCTYPSVGQVTTVVTEGVEAWKGRAGNVEIDDGEPIEGFPAISVWNLADERSCYTLVDVADGQYLMATAAFSVPDPQKAETCDHAYKMAESAMKTLVAT